MRFPRSLPWKAASLALVTACVSGDFDVPENRLGSTPLTGALTLPQPLVSSPAVAARIAVDPLAAPRIQLELTNDEAFAGQWSDWRSTEAPIVVDWQLSPGDGPKTVRARIRDELGREAELAPASIELDASAPSGAIDLVVGGAVNPPYATTAEVSLVFRVSADARWLSVRQGVEGDAPDCSGAEYEPMPESVPPTKSWTLTGGDGPKLLLACFKDAAGNFSSARLETFLDETRPGAPTVVIDGGNDATATLLVTLTVDHLATALEGEEPDRLLIANSECPDTSEENRAMPAAEEPIAWILEAGPDGVRTVFVRAIDAAGNLSEACQSAEIRLDTTPPPAPRVLTLPATTNQCGSFALRIATPAPEELQEIARYELLGGSYTNWTAATGDAQQTDFPFDLLQDSNSRDGTLNVLRIRAVDRVGNPSTDAFVPIVCDPISPRAAEISQDWVVNRSGQATIHWKPSPDTDVAGYRLQYGSAPSTYNGAFAREGLSPVFVPAPPGGGDTVSFTLSGLQDGTLTYVTVEPVDSAGNVGPGPIDTAGEPKEVVLTPNEVAPDLVAQLPVPGMRFLRRMAVYQDHLYVLGTSGQCGAPPITAQLSVIDLSKIEPPLQGNRIPASPPSAPPIVWSRVVETGFTDHECRNGGDLVIDGPYAFVGAGARLHIYALHDPASPAEIATVDLRATQLGSIMNVLARGRLAFVSGPGKLVALSIDKLFDGNAATRPSAADVIGVASSVANPGGLASSRNALILASYISDLQLYDITSASSGTSPSFGNTNLRGVTYLPFVTEANPVASGNLIYFSGSTLSIQDLRPTWAGNLLAPFVSIPSPGFGQFEIAGSEVFLNDTSGPGLRALDLVTPSQARDMGLTPLPAQSYPQSSLVWGNYLLAGGNSLSAEAWVRIYEIAAPRGLHLLSSGPGVLGQPLEVSSGLLYSGDSKVYDLHAGYPLPALTGAYASCSLDGARFGDVVVEANGSFLRVLDLEDAVDRDPSTPYTYTGYQVSLPQGYATAVEAAGNQLVVAERRGSQIWLDVLDARALRDRRGAELSWPVQPPSIQVTTVPLLSGSSEASIRVGLAMHHGRALVTVDAMRGEGRALYVVDLRPALDDDATTRLGASCLQGSFPLPPPSRYASSNSPAFIPPQVVARGHRGFVADGERLRLVALDDAFDNDPATRLDAADQISELPLPGSSSLAVFGNYAIVAPLHGPAIQAVDFSDPTAPEVVGYYPFTPGSGSCGGALPDLWSVPVSVAVSGSLLYVSAMDKLSVFSLE